jgi:hypothetical protein
MQQLFLLLSPCEERLRTAQKGFFCERNGSVTPRNWSPGSGVTLEKMVPQNYIAISHSLHFRIHRVGPGNDMGTLPRYTEFEPSVLNLGYRHRRRCQIGSAVGGKAAEQRRPPHSRQGALGGRGQRPRERARVVGEGGPAVLPTPATRRRRGEPARAGSELRGARGAARGGEGDGCTSGRCVCCRRCRGVCTSGRCDGKRCGYGGRGCWRSHPRNGRCG